MLQLRCQLLVLQYRQPRRRLQLLIIQRQEVCLRLLDLVKHLLAKILSRRDLVPVLLNALVNTSLVLGVELWLESINFLLHFRLFVFELEHFVELVLKLFDLLFLLVEKVLVFLLNLQSLSVKPGPLLVQFGLQSLLLRLKSFSVVVGFLALLLWLPFFILERFGQAFALLSRVLVLYTQTLYLTLHSYVAFVDFSILACFVFVSSSVELFTGQSVSHQ